MLVLSRKAGQGIVLPELDVAVRILEAGKNIRLGVDAPHSVTVLRDEVYRSAEPRPPRRPGIELLGRRESAAQPDAAAEAPAERLMHLIRNHVNKISLAMQLAERARQTGNDAVITEAETRMQLHLDELSQWCSPAAEQQLAAAFGKAYPDATPEPADPGRGRLLIVEDDRDEREMFASLLQQEGYAVTTASDGREAIETLKRRTQAFDALLVDMQMPILSGAEMIHHARRQNILSDAPVLVVSGRCPADYGLPLGADGASCWLPKPISPPLLLDRLDQCLSMAG